MLVPSIAPMPGYSVAATRLRMFGDGLTHGRPVSSNQSSRRQFFIGTTVRSAPILLLAVEQPRQLADRQAVADRHRQVADEADRRRRPATGPSMSKPSIGFGRSSTTTGSLRFAASSSTYAIVGGIGVEARADVLQVDDEGVEAVEHRGGRAAASRRRASGSAGRSSRRATTATRLVELAANAVLGAEQRRRA